MTLNRSPRLVLVADVTGRGRDEHRDEGDPARVGLGSLFALIATVIVPLLEAVG